MIDDNPVQKVRITDVIKKALFISSEKPYFLKYILSSLSKTSHNQYIKFQNLQIVSPSKDDKILNALGHYLRKHSALNLISAFLKFEVKV